MNTDIAHRLESIEALLLAIVPWHKLTQAQKAKMGPLMERNAPEKTGSLEERKKFVKREYLKLLNLTPAKKLAAKFPRALISQDAGHKIHPCVPLSILANRCRARKAFSPITGEDSAAQNVLDAIAACGFVTATLEQLGMLRFSDVPVVLTREARTQINPVIFPPDDEDEEVPFKIDEDLLDEPRAATKKKRFFGDDEDEEVPPLAERMKAAHEAEVASGAYAEYGGSEEDEKPDITFDWTKAEPYVTGPNDIHHDLNEDGPGDPALDEEEQAEQLDTTDIVERAASVRAKIEAELDEDLVDDEDLSDDDFGKLGSDEIEFHNPERERFEREAREAAERDEAKLASGEYYLRNGIITKKSGC
jgi:hypothetical protein